MKIFFKIVIVVLSTTETLAAPIVTGFGKPSEPDLGAFPFQASLMQRLRDNKTYHSFCGGSLIHPYWILTAAHCIQIDASQPAMKASEVYVALGSIYRSAQGAQILRVRQLIIHEAYLHNDTCDIGLVNLRSPPKFGKNVGLARLHTSKEDLIGETATLTGFGIIDDLYNVPIRLRKATLHISNNRECFSDRQADSEICATSTIHEGKACKGDSGGPLTIQRNGKYIQIGITSHLAILPFCRISFNHSVYTRVSAFIAWITKKTGTNFMAYNKA